MGKLLKNRVLGGLAIPGKGTGWGGCISHATNALSLPIKIAEKRYLAKSDSPTWRGKIILQ